MILERRRSLRQRKVNALAGGKMLAVGKIPKNREMHGDKHWEMYRDGGH